MRTPTNTFKQAIGQPGARIGLWLGLADPYAAELCATAGFDWLLLDGEHGPNDLRSMLGALQAVAAYPASHPVLRVPHGDTALIKQVLEIGATTLLVPMVESAAQARELVRATRYPPQGARRAFLGFAVQGCRQRSFSARRQLLSRLSIVSADCRYRFRRHP
jgi:4-hydroxy-2-oxoheptanedioate aldolase